MYLVGDFIPQKTKPVLPDYFGNELVLANLEGPVCSDGMLKGVKVGVHLHSSPFDVPGRWAFSLANNHLMDYGWKGLCQTRGFLESKGYLYAGAGGDESAARKPMLLTESGKTIAVFSCCERQFGLATSKSVGVAEKGLWLLSSIVEAKTAGADFVIVSCHAASEFSPFVNPRLRDFYHTLVDAGADVIHGHHSHVPQGWEEYCGKPIFYGLGNFVVDTADWSSKPHYRWSLVAHVDFSTDAPTWRIDPYGLIPSDVTSYLDAANAGFKNADLLAALWQEASVYFYPRIYEQNLRAPSVMAHRLSVRDRVRKILFGLRDMGPVIIGRECPSAKSLFYGRVLYNYVNCESHYDMLATALGLLTGVLPDLRSVVSAEMSKIAIGGQEK